MSTTQDQEKTYTKISADMTIEDILSKFPHKSQKLAHEITKSGLSCVGCQAATWETLEAGMLGHGMTLEQVQRLVDKLNAVLAEESDPESVQMTARAAKKFKEILFEEGKEGWGLRFGEQAAGCSGLEYILDYSEKADEDDAVFTSHDIEIHVKKTLLNRLLGCEIDFIEGLNGSGFKISNPNAKAACGCGSSHNY
ncbi:MAG: iron-sulfur cluster assembly accessory protein [Parachlamydiales bacterium]|nr:iron-sulfur cluster assembly accessory protein [Parachlamydiales bacterium]